MLYDFGVRTKKPNVEFLAKSLVVLALSIDIGSVIQTASQKKRAKRQLLALMPDRAMDELLNVIMPHPLSELICKWNDRNHIFAINS